MGRSKLNILRPTLGVLGMSNGDLLSRLNAVHDKMLNNPAYADPPVGLADFKASVDAYTVANAAALDGSKAAIAEREKHRADAISMFRRLGHYVESACMNDMATFVSSGFVLSRAGQRTPPQPVDVPSIIRLDQGSTGQLLVCVKPVTKARSYDIRYAAGPADGGAADWAVISVPGVRPAVAINYLTRGVNYSVQARAFGRLGLSDWSNPVERMCI